MSTYRYRSDSDGGMMKVYDCCVHCPRDCDMPDMHVRQCERCSGLANAEEVELPTPQGETDEPPPTPPKQAPPPTDHTLHLRTPSAEDVAAAQEVYQEMKLNGSNGIDSIIGSMDGDEVPLHIQLLVMGISLREFADVLESCAVDAHEDPMHAAHNAARLLRVMGGLMHLNGEAVHNQFQAMRSRKASLN